MTSNENKTIAKHKSAKKNSGWT